MGADAATVATLAGPLLAGDRRSLARAITLAENGGPESIALLNTVHPRTGRAWRIGVTGPPGAGKSTLTARLVRALRAADKRVAVIAIDPSSPFTHGAILGDRVRMTDVSMDDGVFIRSMATRGAVGGLARAASDAADLLDAAGFDVVIIETAGVGQTELEIADAADTTVLVLVPESGDFVQALKAGIMEIADLYVLNKCDRPGASEALHAIQAMLVAQRPQPGDWRRQVLEAVAAEGRGIEAVVAECRRHREHLVATGGLAARRAEHLVRRVRALVDVTLAPHLWDGRRSAALDARRDDLVAGRIAPHALARAIVASYHDDVRNTPAAAR